MAQTEDKAEAAAAQPQAGTVITPGGTQKPAAAPEPVPQTEPETPAPRPDSPVPSADEAINPPAGAPLPSDPATITWTASEFVAHQKSAGWYALLAVVTVALAAGVYLLMRDVISVGVIIVAGLVMGMYAGRQPRQLEYALNHQGFSIGPKHHAYDEFRWFSVMQEGAFSGILFMPLKRFAATTTIYYPPEDEDRILAIITDHLPLEEHRYDAVDNLMRRIRF